MSGRREGAGDTPASTGNHQPAISTNKYEQEWELNS
jgi:hypothetical protein